jgi:maltose O-acetyltransferase
MPETAAVAGVGTRPGPSEPEQNGAVLPGSGMARGLPGVDKMSLIRRISNQFMKIGRAVVFLHDPEHFHSRVNRLRRHGMKIGHNVSILHDTILDPSRPFLIEIGNNVTFAPRCHVLTHDASMHVFLKTTRLGKVRIRDNCFIGAGSIILPNVTIGPNAVVGAGSVVTRSVPAGSVYAGNPARFLCSLEDFLRKHEDFAKNHPCYPYPECHARWITKEQAALMATEIDATFGYSVG